MKAAFITQYGSDSKITLGDLPTPAYLSTQVLIKVSAAGVNPVDFHVRNGTLADSNTHTLPLILGWDAAGIIAHVGDDVDHLKVGDEVFVFSPIAQQGTYAEFLAVDANLVAIKPTALSMTESAGVPLAALTALQGLMAGQLKKDQSVLILGGSGGVGGFAIQIAKSIGAHVITTASAKNEEYVKSLGADEVIDYKSVEFDDVVKNIDVVFVTANGNDVVARSLQITKKGGYVVSTLDDIDTSVAEASGVNFSRMWVHPNSSHLEEIRELIDNKKIIVKIDSVYPLAQANDAVLKSESNRAVGKIIINME
ncbi:NADP-dependent oxidoreductase [Neptunomonas japonica]|uniref:NADPH2:quinone reductase n=1 Tax=Neptunomonas japonica JAMM 1380 TaxID=1441457 RepID=A0A7R6SVX3_9GAMM|nr:NADP-dependent oxidoreductase [Neptunomonas japonica]BBB29851.1 NADPH2:quinone reductase [Neptunomonas japonica JAMM 1380]